jgi:hypothetical protein
VATAALLSGRLSLVVLFAASLGGPWVGCDRNLDPVEPPATPPAERAPAEVTAPPDGLLLLTATRRLG